MLMPAGVPAVNVISVELDAWSSVPVVGEEVTVKLPTTESPGFTTATMFSWNKVIVR